MEATETTEAPLAPKPKGPRSVFAPKQPPNRTHSMTQLDKDVLAAFSERTGVSESDLVCWAVRVQTWGPGGTAEQFFASVKADDVAA